MAQFTNQATLSYTGGTVNSNIVTGEITQVLTAWKASTTDEYRIGDTVTYVVNIQNSGTIDYNGLTITDDLGAYAFGASTVTPLTYTGDTILYSINGRLQAAPTVAAESPLTITGINVPAGGNAEVIYSVRVNGFAQPTAGGTIDNTATITGAGLTEAITASETIATATTPLLSIFKELSPTTVVENGEITYTFIIQNTAPVAANTTDSVVITDTFAPALEDGITVTLNGATLAEAGNYTYDAATGLFATNAGVITVPAATYTQDVATGAWSVTPGIATLTVTGTI